MCSQVSTVIMYVLDLGLEIGQSVSQMGTKKTKSNGRDLMERKENVCLMMFFYISINPIIIINIINIVIRYILKYLFALNTCINAF